MLLVLVIHFVSSVSSAPQTRYYRRSAQNTDHDVEVEVLEQIGQEAAGGESERLTTSSVQNTDFSSDIARVLAAANAEPTAITRGVSYGKRSAIDTDSTLFREDMDAFRVKRSAQNAAEDVEIIDQAAVASSNDKQELRDASFNAAIANVLAAANAQPKPVSRGGGSSYGKRSAQNAAENEDVEIIDEAAVNANQESGSLRSASFNAAIANVLAAANAQSTPVDPVGGYGKRSAMDKGDATMFRADTEAIRSYGKRSLRSRRAPQDLAGPEHPAEVDPVDPEAHPSGVPASVIAQILKAAGAKPQPVVPGDISYLGKREAEENIEAAEAALAEIPLAAVKISPHSSHGNIVQHYDGDAAYQNSVHVSRFGRARRSNDDFIPFHVYDARRVKTLKVEQNDFLALKARNAEEAREKRNHQQEKDNKNQK